MPTATNEEFIVCNVYAPTRNKVQEQMKYINHVKDTFSQLDCVHFIIGGILIPFLTLNSINKVAILTVQICTQMN